MAYKFLPQVQALSKSKSQTIAISMPSVPQLAGPSKGDIEKFNAEMRMFVQDLVLKISQGLTESPKQN